MIERTIQGALDSDYPNLRVIVIDDGSKDRTLEVAQKAFRKQVAEGIVVILNKPNSGKADALNFGLEHIGDAEILSVLMPTRSSHPMRSLAWCPIS